MSFYLFQALSYVIDVHRGRAVSQQSLVRFALFVALFPQLIAGPILRYAPFAAQLGDRVISIGDLAEGVRRFVRGLAKKVLVADVLAPFCDAAFALPAGALPVGIAWGAGAVFALQIYYDFSGYTDMAIGLGRMLGFRFPENFQYPYAARSVSEFWQRWHITLTTWFRDYLVPALGRSRGRRWRKSVSVFVVFVACGLWHGASWHFVLWGAYHGLFLVLERHGLGKLLGHAPRLVGSAYLHIMLAFNWPLFRCATVSSALHYQGVMLGFGSGSVPPGVDLYLDGVQWCAIAAGILFALPVRAWWRHLGMPRLGQTTLDGVSTVVHLGLLAVVLVRIASGTWRTFIYFRF